MKEFKDLDFKKNSNSVFGLDEHAEIHFDNDYGVSVITGSSAYTSSTKPYEVAVLYKGGITYNTHITDNVVGYCNEQRVTEIMKQVQEL